MSDCQDPSLWVKIMGLVNFLTLALDAWLGKTNKTKSGSIFEMLYNILKLVPKIFTPTKETTMEDQTPQPVPAAPVKQDVKNILELLSAIEHIGVFGRKVMADGKVSVADLPLLLDLLQKQAALVEGFKDLGEIKAEAKDLDEAESAMLLAKLFNVYRAIKAA